MQRIESIMVGPVSEISGSCRAENSVSGQRACGQCERGRRRRQNLGRCGRSVYRRSDLFHDRVETCCVIGNVFDDAYGAIRFHQRIGAFDYVAVTNFLLRFSVSCQTIGYAVVVLVFWMCLCEYKIGFLDFFWYLIIIIK